MTALAPLETLLDATAGCELPLPPELARLYGRLRLPTRPHRPHVVANFVSTLDGVVSLAIPGKAGGREISGDNPHDRLVMGLLRAAADAVVVGAGTFRASSKRRWTADAAYPPLADAFSALRTNLGKREPALNVVVTGGGDLDLDWPPGDPGEVPLLVVTTEEGARRLRARRLPPAVDVVQEDGPLTAGRVLAAVRRVRSSALILVEAGPRMMGQFLAEQQLDELFLTLAPQVAGRAGSLDRPGLVAGQRFAPEQPLWGTLVDVKRGGSHLFFRYRFSDAGPTRAAPDSKSGAE